MAAYFDQLLDARVAEPADDLATYVTHGRDRRPADSARAAARVPVAADPRRHRHHLEYALGTALWHLGTHPGDLWLGLPLQEPELLPTAVEEFLRAYAPVSVGGRIVARDGVLGGLPRASRRTAYWCRSVPPTATPEVVERADEFVIDREATTATPRSGCGIHRCLGSNLARLELRVALQEWLSAFPNYEVDPTRETTWVGGQVRGPRCVPVLLNR